jgi:hypothetical protein
VFAESEVQSFGKIAGPLHRRIRSLTQYSLPTSGSYLGFSDVNFAAARSAAEVHPARPLSATTATTMTKIRTVFAPNRRNSLTTVARAQVVQAIRKVHFSASNAEKSGLARSGCLS